MSISKADLADVPELNRLVNSAYRGEDSKKGWTTEAHLLDGIRIDEETLRSYFDNPNIILLKNTDETGQITGTVYLEVRRPKLYIGMFSVAPALQGAGVGRSLLANAENISQWVGCNILTMTVISTRSELISWYERRGFTATGEVVPFHDGTKFGVPKQHIDLIVMEKYVGK